MMNTTGQSFCMANNWGLKGLLGLGLTSKHLEDKDLPCQNVFDIAWVF